MAAEFRGRTDFWATPLGFHPEMGPISGLDPHGINPDTGPKLPPGIFLTKPEALLRNME